MLIIEFHYFNKEKQDYINASLEFESFYHFKVWLRENNIEDYEIFNIKALD